ncbi:hypothetical protein IMZ48_39420 [Candidatus Bathyarchaeota archaeon]|nr:hypothetical protein [Candidatus Bathyarchaeota archaeon]
MPAWQWQGCRFQGSGQGKVEFALRSIQFDVLTGGTGEREWLLLAQGLGDEAQPRESMSFFVFLRILDPRL